MNRDDKASTPHTHTPTLPVGVRMGLGLRVGQGSLIVSPNLGNIGTPFTYTATLHMLLVT